MSSEEQYRVFISVCVFFSEQLQLLNTFTLTNTKIVCIFLFFFLFFLVFFAGGEGVECFTTAHITVIIECIIIAN